MPEKLFESDLPTVNLRTIFARANADNNVTPSEPLPAKGDWKAWEDLLKKRLKENTKQTDYEIRTSFFEEFFKVNWGDALAKKLILLGEPLRKALEIIKFTENNPILAFLNQKFVKEELLSTGLLNVNTFKAIYNAVAKKLVADSEFFKVRTYNIIYCKDLYRKTAVKMEEYLQLQSRILQPSANSYSVEKQNQNKKIFFYISNITESDIAKRAIEINKPETMAVDSGEEATLNSLDLAKQIIGNHQIDTVTLNTAEQDKIVSKLNSVPEIFATILSLSLSTDSKKAKEALANEMFSNLSGADVVKAVMKLASEGTIPKGQLTKSDTDLLIPKLLARLKNS
jgi:hypothetical protein